MKSMKERQELIWQALLDGRKKRVSEIAELIDEEPTYTRNALQKMLEAGKVEGMMKIKITPRKPDEVGGYLMMPLVANVPNGRKGWKIVKCPECGAACWYRPEQEQVRAIAVCTMINGNWRSPSSVLAVAGRIVILHVKERKMRFKKGDVIRHFKREMLTKEQIEENGALFTYEFLGVAEHTETKEKLVLYKALYDGESIGLPVKKGDIFARPYDMFFSEVDYQKYPGIKQKYRFEF